MTRDLTDAEDVRQRVDLAMSVEFDHTLVHAKNHWAAAREVCDVLGLGDPTAYGPFAVLSFANGASLHFIQDSGTVTAQHYAFLVSEADFDAIWGRITEQDRPFWGDRHKQAPGQINHEDGGRGVYWESPDGHWLEMITRPYGSGG